MQIEKVNKIFRMFWVNFAFKFLIRFFSSRLSYYRIREFPSSPPLHEIPIIWKKASSKSCLALHSIQKG